jgi:hypothetical protein
MVSSRFDEVVRANLWSQHCDKEAAIFGRSTAWVPPATTAATAAAATATATEATAVAASAVSWDSARGGDRSAAAVRPFLQEHSHSIRARGSSMMRPFLQEHSHSIRARGSSMLCRAARDVARSGTVSVTARICNPAIVGQGRRLRTPLDVQLDNDRVRGDHSKGAHRPVETSHVGQPFIGQWAAVTAPTQLVHDVAAAEGSLLSKRRADLERAATASLSSASNVNLHAPKGRATGRLVSAGLGRFVFGSGQRFRLAKDTVDMTAPLPLALTRSPEPVGPVEEAQAQQQQPLFATTRLSSEVNLTL